jgi:hypothetical protein
MLLDKLILVGDEKDLLHGYHRLALILQFETL